MKAFFNYYLVSNLFNLVFTIVIMVLWGMQYAPYIFASAGTCIGVLCFNFYFSDQYYFYHNLGYTRGKLFQMLLVANIITATPFLLLMQLIT